MKILSIETSCDETGLALVEASGGLGSSSKDAPRFRVLKNLVSSQIEIHRPFGGVVPNIAKREHLKNLPILFEKIAGKNVSRFMDSIDLITVTVGPGLEPALWTGIEFAKTLALAFKKPLIGANHLEGHLYSFLLTMPDGKKNNKLFPAVALIVSGGHTILLRVESFSKWKRLGETRDDAAGEAFDKVARLLDLPYPGGPEIEKLAATGGSDGRGGDPTAIAFPRPMMHDKNYDFSFSGLKTSVLYYMRNTIGAPMATANAGTGHLNVGRSDTATGSNNANKKINKADIAASFQQAATDVLVAKTIRAAREFGARSVILCGGVAANKFLRKTLKKESEKIGGAFFVPDFKYNLDNGAMIAAAGYMAHLRKKKFPFVANGNLGI